MTAQTFCTGTVMEMESICLQPNRENVLEEVVCLDGVFICSRKEVWQQSKFNDADLKGFHFYDIDFSLKGITDMTGSLLLMVSV